MSTFDFRSDGCAPLILGSVRTRLIRYGLAGLPGKNLSRKYGCLPESIPGGPIRKLELCPLLLLVLLLAAAVKDGPTPLRQRLFAGRAVLASLPSGRARDDSIFDFRRQRALL